MVFSGCQMRCTGETTTAAGPGAELKAEPSKPEPTKVAPAPTPAPDVTSQLPEGTAGHDITKGFENGIPFITAEVFFAGMVKEGVYTATLFRINAEKKDSGHPAIKAELHTPVKVLSVDASVVEKRKGQFWVVATFKNPAKDWPSGEYRVVFERNGEKVYTIEETKVEWEGIK